MQLGVSATQPFCYYTILQHMFTQVNFVHVLVVWCPWSTLPANKMPNPFLHRSWWTYNPLCPSRCFVWWVFSKLAAMYGSKSVTELAILAILLWLSVHVSQTFPLLSNSTAWFYSVQLHGPCGGGCVTPDLRFLLTNKLNPFLHRF